MGEWLRTEGVFITLGGPQAGPLAQGTLCPSRNCRVPHIPDFL
jgi:hypothetical protein